MPHRSKSSVSRNGSVIVNNNNLLSENGEEVKESEVTNDVLCSTIGHFGKWQFRILVLMSILQIPIVWFQFSVNFLAPPTNFYCLPSPEYINSTDVHFIEIDQSFIKLKNNITISKNSCVMKDLIIPTNEIYTIKCDWGYYFNNSVIHSSVITEWNLVCDRQYLKQFVQILLVLGMLLGNIVFGAAADRYGRKKILLITILFQAVFSSCSVFLPRFWMFLVTRFLVGFFSGGAESASFVMCMEVVGGKWRTIVNVAFQLSLPIATAMMAGIAYFVRDWRPLQLIFSIVSFLYLAYIWILPKSPLWLLAVGKQEEASIVLKKASKVNGKGEIFIPTSINQVEDAGLLALLKTPNLRKQTILLSLIWLILGINYFGYNQYMGQVKQNIYISVLTGGLISFPSTIGAAFVAIRYGRRINIIVSNICSIICILIIYFLPNAIISNEWRIIGIASQGSFWLGMSLPAIYIFTVEIYPTVLRNSGFGTCATFQKVGAMIVPFIIEYSKTEWLLPAIFGGVQLLQALLVLPLPETQNKILPETIEDAENSELLPDNGNKRRQDYGTI